LCLKRTAAEPGKEVEMKYSVETTENGFVETLWVNGQKFVKRWEREKPGMMSCKDREFNEQIESSGLSDDDAFLEAIYDNIDENFFGHDFESAEKLLH